MHRSRSWVALTALAAALEAVACRALEPQIVTEAARADVACRSPSAPISPAPTESTESAVSPSPIVQAGHPALRARAADVPAETLASPRFRAFVADMIAAMRRAPGVGLAAPQLGVPLRVIVLEDREALMSKLTPEERAERERAAFGPRVFVNPVLTPIGPERATFFEGCLSVRGYVGMVDRAREVEVSGLDELGRPVRWRVRGWPARILQHEVDHVNGTLYVDRMLTRSFVTADQAKAMFAGKPITEVKALLGI